MSHHEADDSKIFSAGDLVYFQPSDSVEQRLEGAMQSITVMILICGIYGALAGVGFVDDTKIEDCSGEVCVDVCEFEGLTMLPGTEIINDGNCRKVMCNLDFSVSVTYCSAFNTFERCKNLKGSQQKLSFPKCCEKPCRP